MKRLTRAAIIVAVVVVILIMPPMRMFESMTVMSIYSAMNDSKSLLKDENITIHMPGGWATKAADWYPLVMTFHADDGFSNFIGKPNTRLTIMYNFPTFSPLNGCSNLFDENSPYYSSFYGAYAVKNDDGRAYGFVKEGEQLKLDLDSTALVPKYDFQRLVLSDFGLDDENAVFEWEVTEAQDDVNYAGMRGFSRADATLKVNGCAHNAQRFVQSYLQYGVPSFQTDEPLSLVSMYGRVYGKYFEEKGISIFFYIITADKAVLEDCDEEILSKSTITFH